MTVRRLVDIEVVTTLGATYKFPDIDDVIVPQLMSSIGRAASLSLVNESNACLVLPVRIIEKLIINGVEKWTRPIPSSA